MATIVTRSGKGSALTHTEMDNNFTNLNTDKAELSGATFTGNITSNTGANTNLVLDEDGIDRSSGSAETFNIQNSGAGAMTLQVDADPVLMSANDLSDVASAGTARTNLGLGALAVLGDIDETNIDWANAGGVSQSYFKPNDATSLTSWITCGEPLVIYIPPNATTLTYYATMKTDISTAYFRLNSPTANGTTASTVSSSYSNQSGTVTISADSGWTTMTPQFYSLSNSGTATILQVTFGFN